MTMKQTCTTQIDVDIIFLFDQRHFIVCRTRDEAVWSRLKQFRSGWERLASKPVRTGKMHAAQRRRKMQVKSTYILRVNTSSIDRPADRPGGPIDIVKEQGTIHVG